MCVARVFENGAESIGLDGVSDSPQQRGLDNVSEFVADFTLSAVLHGLGASFDSDEGRRIIAAYVAGKQSLDPSEFIFVIKRGKLRNI